MIDDNYRENDTEENWRKNKFFKINGTQLTGYSYKKRSYLIPTSYCIHSMNYKWIMDLNAKDTSSTFKR